MGYDYDMVSRFAADKGMHLSLRIAPSLSRAVELLDSGLIDLLAYEVPVTGEYRQRVIHCGIENATYQVLVQPKRGKQPLISDVTQLVGREVYVEESSKYLQRLNNLNEELGGGIIIHEVDRDTLITEDLMEMVSKGEIPLTVVDSDIGRLNKTYYNDLDITRQQMACRQHRYLEPRGETTAAAGHTAQTIFRVEQGFRARDSRREDRSFERGRVAF